jgi:hypothetical protein
MIRPQPELDAYIRRVAGDGARLPGRGTCRGPWSTPSAAALSCIAVGVAVVMKPTTWTGGNQLGGGFYIDVSWTYGAVVALAAVVVSLAVTVSAIRDRVSR